MPFLREFAAYLPERVVSNAEIGSQVGCDAEWIKNVSGIEQRRFAAENETVTDLAVRAAEACLAKARISASALGMIMIASGSSERQFPGPAATVAHRLGLDSTPALDVPMASAGTLYAVALASRLCDNLGEILVVGAEKMSTVVNCLRISIC